MHTSVVRVVNAELTEQRGVRLLMETMSDTAAVSLTISKLLPMKNRRVQQGRRAEARTSATSNQVFNPSRHDWNAVVFRLGRAAFRHCEQPARLQSYFLFHEYQKSRLFADGFGGHTWVFLWSGTVREIG